MSKPDLNVASAPFNLIDLKQQCARRKCDIAAASRTGSRAGKATLDAEEKRVWIGAIRVILDCFTPYSGTIGRQRASETSTKTIERGPGFSAHRSAAGRPWNDFTRNELEHIVQDGEIAKLLLRLVDESQPEPRDLQSPL